LESLSDRKNNYWQFQGKKPKAIAVHLYGVPYKVEAIKGWLNIYSVLEDSAEALGSSYKGQKCGTFGNIGFIF
jgi:dTDP-4-amino-4,6-dideoxygalactose transaminase